MRRFRFLALVLVGPILLVAAKDKDAWKQFVDKDGGFVVSMPGIPLKQQVIRKTPVGPLRLVVFVGERKQEETAFIVSYCDFPELVLKNSSLDKRLDDARNRAVADAHGKLTGEKKVNLEGHPGRELSFEVAGGGVVHMRFYAVKDRLYQVLVAGSKNRMVARSGDRFLDSFRLR
jgi:hypothetical protein